MNSSILFLMGLLAVLLIPSCMDNDLDVNQRAVNSNGSQYEESSPQKDSHTSMHQDKDVKNFRAHLSGDEEVPANDSRATGEAIFRITQEGSLYYKVTVANIENVRMAHIHMAPAGQNGGVIAWLYPKGPPPQIIEGRFQGVLAEGTITEDDIGDRTFEEFIEAIEAGNTYVNVHTNQYPGGEIRGQIR